MDHPTAGRIKLTGSPLKLLGTPPQIDEPPPLLGEHTEAILTKVLGLDAVCIAGLRAPGPSALDLTHVPGGPCPLQNHDRHPLAR